MDSPKPYGGTDSITARSKAMRPIADVRLPAHIIEEDVPELDDARVQEKAERYYFRSNWGGYKGHVRGMLAGTGIGALFGGIVGAAAWGILGIPAVMGFLGFTAVTLPALPLVVAGFMISGITIGSNGFGAVGTAAGAKAASLAEKHARQLVKSNLVSPKQGATADLEADEPSFEGRYKHHYEVPPDRDSGTLYHSKTGLIGAVMGAGVGGLFTAAIPILAKTALVAEAGHAASMLNLVFGSTALMVGGALTVPAIIGCVAAFALFGASFGINRSAFKSVFNLTDGWVKGKAAGREKDTVEKALEQARTPEEREAILIKEKAVYETAMRRQDKIYDLEKGYFNNMFWHGIGGRFEGFMGGGIAGMAIGAVAGGLTALALAAALGTGGGLLILAGLVGGASLGGNLGMEIFGEAGTQAGVESMGKAIDEEFQRGRALNAKGMSPNISSLKKDGGLINFKTLALCTAVGAIGGVALAPFLAATGLAGILTGGAAAAGHAAAGVAAHGAVAATTTAAVTTTGAAISAVPFAISGAFGGIIGALYGVKAKVFQGIANFTNGLYEGNIFGKDGTEHAKEHEKVKVPVTSIARVGSRGAIDEITSEDVAALNARMPQAQNVSQVGRLQQQQTAPQPSLAPAGR